MGYLPYQLVSRISSTNSMISFCFPPKYLGVWITRKHRPVGFSSSLRTSRFAGSLAHLPEIHVEEAVGLDGSRCLGGWRKKTFQRCSWKSAPELFEMVQADSHDLGSRKMRKIMFSGIWYFYSPSHGHQVLFFGTMNYSFHVPYGCFQK